MKIRDRLVERRNYIRLKTPVPIAYTVLSTGVTQGSFTKDISAEGLRFESSSKNIEKSNILDMKLEIDGARNPVHVKARVVWKKKLGIEDNTPYDIGVEFVEIEEDNKNTFLKFLCDLIYNLHKER